MARRSLRTRTALVSGLGFFVISAVLLIAVGQLVQQRVADTPEQTTELLVTELGLEADDVTELTVTDPSGNSVTADQIRMLLQRVVETTRTDIARIFLLVLPVLAAAAAAVGWWLAGRATRPVLAVTSHARQVSSESLDARVDYVGPDDELSDLAHEFDTMMERLEHAFAAQKQFSAAASHELRTPLTVIRTELDVALDTPNPSREELDDMAEGVRSAIARSEKVIDGLLTLARSGIVDLTAEADLADVVSQALDDAQEAIAARGITVRKTVASGTEVWCDPVLIERMICNLVDNAVRYNDEGGSLEIDVIWSSGDVITRIANTGPELDEATVARLGEPFYRASFSGRVPGTGLGVAIARSIAEAHGGGLEIEPRAGSGVVATVTLPGRETRNGRAS